MKEVKTMKGYVTVFDVNLDRNEKNLVYLLFFFIHSVLDLNKLLAVICFETSSVHASRLIFCTGERIQCRL